MRRRGFTLVELMAVVAIIAILVTVVMVSAAGAIRQSRVRRAEAMRVALEQSISAYYAQTGKWPGPIESVAQDGREENHTFSAAETDKIFQEVVGKGFGKSGSRSILVDASALFVADAGKLSNGGRGCSDNHADRRAGDYCGDKGCIPGRDFTSAVNRNRKGAIPFSSLAFGYQGTECGKFRRFWITYHSKTDSVTVSR